MAQVDVDTEDAEEFLQLFIDKLQSQRLSRTWRGDAEKHFRERIRARFKSDGDSASGAWAPLKDPRPRGQRILRQTRKLYKYITRVRANVEYDDDGFYFLFPGTYPSNDKTYWGYMIAQQGAPNHNTPQRKIVAFDATDSAKLTELLLREIS